MPDEVKRTRRLPVGAEVLARGGVEFRVWAPRRKTMHLVIEGQDRRPDVAREVIALSAEAGGYFSGTAPAAGHGTLYRFRLDDDEALYPDPASRYQPQGPHGPSQVVDPATMTWTDAPWKGVRLEGQVIYELHIGTFTPEGTWAAAGRQLEHLADLGITVVEVMPVHDFPGRFGWGYDGVNLFAPTRLYGTPADFRAFVDRAHSLGIGVILDVVYNHFGPDGNYLKQFSHDYFTDAYVTDWGEAINFDNERAGPVREFVVANAGYWIDEFHLDGLRLDATQSVCDGSADHILAALTRRARAAAAGRSIIIVAENEPQDTTLTRRPEEGGYGMDALWNDDFHHAAMVVLTGRREAYYTDYRGSPQEFISAIKYGYLYQGQRYEWQHQRRGTPSLGCAPATFVTFIQNHDQVANTARGERCHQTASPGRYRAMTALMLLAPGTPMLFQGQEFAASAPFLYFADHEADLAQRVRAGRGEFLTQFPSYATPEAQTRLNDPALEATFARCRLDFGERARHGEIYAMHRDLLTLRREDRQFSAQRRRGVDGAVLGAEAFVLRYLSDDGDDRLVIVNLGPDLDLRPAPEPLLAPPPGTRWRTLWSSEDIRYGGRGNVPLEIEDVWHLPGHATVALAPAALAAAEKGSA